jgi:hypothetical protein
MSRGDFFIGATRLLVNESRLNVIDEKGLLG